MHSAYTDSNAIIEAVNRGAIHSYFVKPCSNTALRAGVRDAFRHFREQRA